MPNYLLVLKGWSTSTQSLYCPVPILDFLHWQLREGNPNYMTISLPSNCEVCLLLIYTDVTIHTKITPALPKARTSLPKFLFPLHTSF